LGKMASTRTMPKTTLKPRVSVVVSDDDGESQQTGAFNRSARLPPKRVGEIPRGLIFRTPELDGLGSDRSSPLSPNELRQPLSAALQGFLNPSNIHAASAGFSSEFARAPHNSASPIPRKRATAAGRSSGAAPHSSDAINDPSNKMRQAVFATMFLNRLKGNQPSPEPEQSKVSADLGSLLNFIELQRLGEESILEDVHDASSNLPGPSPTPSDAQPQSEPPSVTTRSRRTVHRLGDKVSKIRTACPRNQQLHNLLAEHKERTQENGVPEVKQTVAEVVPKAAPLRSRAHDGKRAASMHDSPVQAQQRLQKRAANTEPRTNFTHDFVAGVSAKPRQEHHPLLTVMLAMQDNGLGGREPDLEQAALSQHLAELRWSEVRLGKWAQAPGKRKPHGGEDLALRRAIETFDSRERSEQHTLKHATPEVVTKLRHLISVMDPSKKGFISPDVFIPLMFWLGYCRRRSAALSAIQHAFGEGDVSVASVLGLGHYVDVQLRLVSGFKVLTRKESLEQLCEFITNWTRLRAWFYSMKLDPVGRVDVVEVANLFSRMEVTPDNSSVFRFLSHIVRSGNLPVRSKTTNINPGQQSGVRDMTFGIENFASLLCRCMLTACLYQTTQLVHLPVPSPSKSSDEVEHCSEYFWTQLRRKIMVSLLINQNFWGPESRHVLSAMLPPAKSSDDILTPEQWLSLFQRVRAQGLSATLPAGDEADDPDFLIKKLAPVTGTESHNKAATSSFGV